MFLTSSELHDSVFNSSRSFIMEDDSCDGDAFVKGAWF